MADKIFIGKHYEDRFALAKIVLTQEDVTKLQDILNKGNEKVSILAKKSQNGKLYNEVDQYGLNQ